MTPSPSTPIQVPSAPMTQDSPAASQPGAPSGPDANRTGTYLNQFKEIADLIERLPNSPELIGDILNWRPTTYNDYFAEAATSGRASAADVYASLNRCSGNRFEGVASDLDCKAIGAAAAIRRHFKTHGEARPDIMTEICDRAGKNLRAALGKANSIAKSDTAPKGNAGSVRSEQAT